MVLAWKAKRTQMFSCITANEVSADCPCLSPAISKRGFQFIQGPE